MGARPDLERRCECGHPRLEHATLAPHSCVGECVDMLRGEFVACDCRDFRDRAFRDLSPNAPRDPDAGGQRWGPWCRPAPAASPGELLGARQNAAGRGTLARPQLYATRAMLEHNRRGSP
jgi:hypothetical protein